jgi:hypothetical protein
MEPLLDEEPARRGPSFAEKLVVGCGLFIVLLVLFIAVMALAFQRACACATHVVAQRGHVVHVAANLDLTLLNYRYSGGTARDTPHPGLQFLVTRWQLYNPGSAPRPINAFQAVSGLHVLAPDRGLRDLRSTLPRGTLSPGGEVVGTLVFEIEQHASMVEVNYRSGSFEATWQFGR